MRTAFAVILTFAAVAAPGAQGAAITVTNMFHDSYAVLDYCEKPIRSRGGMVSIGTFSIDDATISGPTLTMRSGDTPRRPPSTASNGS